MPSLMMYVKLAGPIWRGVGTNVTTAPVKVAVPPTEEVIAEMDNVSPSTSESLATTESTIDVFSTTSNVSATATGAAFGA